MTSAGWSRPESAQPTLPGIDEACRVLAAGQAVVVPNPSPMTYGIVATSPRPVNALKRRPLDQHVAISLHDAAEWQRVTPSLDLPPDMLPTIAALMHQRLSLLVPLRSTRTLPGWTTPAVHDGYLTMFSGRWYPLAQLWDRFPHLYGSSANRTGEPPAACAAAAARTFGSDAPVVDGDALRDLGRVHAASSMLRVAPDGTLTLSRRGAHDAGLDTDAYLRQVALQPDRRSTLRPTTPQ